MKFQVHLWICLLMNLLTSLLHWQRLSVCLAFALCDHNSAKRQTVWLKRKTAASLDGKLSAKMRTIHCWIPDIFYSKILRTKKVDQISKALPTGPLGPNCFIACTTLSLKCFLIKKSTRFQNSNSSGLRKQLSSDCEISVIKKISWKLVRTALDLKLKVSQISIGTVGKTATSSHQRRDR